MTENLTKATFLEKVFNFKPSDELRTHTEEFTRKVIRDHWENYVYP